MCYSTLSNNTVGFSRSGLVALSTPPFSKVLAKLDKLSTPTISALSFLTGLSTLFKNADF